VRGGGRKKILIRQSSPRSRPPPILSALVPRNEPGRGEKREKAGQGREKDRLPRRLCRISSCLASLRRHRGERGEGEKRNCSSPSFLFSINCGRALFGRCCRQYGKKEGGRKKKHNPIDRVPLIFGSWLSCVAGRRGREGRKRGGGGRKKKSWVFRPTAGKCEPRPTNLDRRFRLEGEGKKEKGEKKNLYSDLACGPVAFFLASTVSPGSAPEGGEGEKGGKKKRKKNSLVLSQLTFPSWSAILVARGKEEGGGKKNEPPWTRSLPTTGNQKNQEEGGGAQGGGRVFFLLPPPAYWRRMMGEGGRGVPPYSLPSGPPCTKGNEITGSGLVAHSRRRREEKKSAPPRRVLVSSPQQGRGEKKKRKKKKNPLSIFFRLPTIAPEGTKRNSVEPAQSAPFSTTVKQEKKKKRT